MGSVSRGRQSLRRRGWGGDSPSTNGMASWAWLLTAVLLSLATATLARPPYTAAEEEEATLEPEDRRDYGEGGKVGKSYDGAEPGAHMMTDQQGRFLKLV